MIPKRAFSGEPLEQNAARQIAFESFPAEARLRKVGMEIQRKRMILTFDFPEQALNLYGEMIEAVSDQTGWEVVVNPQVNQQALGLAVMELLPPGGQVIKGPSYYLDQREVQVDVRGVDDTDDLARAYADLTGHRLRINAGKGEIAVATAAAPGGHQQMEINAAHGILRLALEPFGLMRTSLKQGQIVLSFISPQVGARHQEAIASLAEEKGYAISVYPHPDQNAILQVVQRLVREAGWQIRKGRGLHVERAQVVMTLASKPDAEQMRQVDEALEAETGYRPLINA